MPLAGGFLKEEEIKDEVKYPLEVYVCRRCSLVQILDVIPKEILFTNYKYLSSVTSTLSEHFAGYAREMQSRFLNENNSLVVEIGSNDGVLLQHFTKLAVKAVGVEPAENVAEIARAKGLQIVNSYFTKQVAQEVRQNNGRAKVICANNVFAHIDDIDEVMEGIQTLLEDDGVFVFEVHYLIDLLDKYQYDTVYHEHLCYYSLTALSYLLNRYGMEIFDVKRIPIHSGSIRVYAKNKSNNKQITQSIVNDLLAEEKAVVHNIDVYRAFSESISLAREQLLDTLHRIKNDGKRIIGYGAPGRGTILLNYCSIGKEILDYIVDASPLRQGLLVPGMHIPIISPETIGKDLPDYILILAWSYEKEILTKEKEYLNKGGRFIMPLPIVRIIST